eukprot:6847874-Karenia_brevis.AAC.1
MCILRDITLKKGTCNLSKYQFDSDIEIQNAAKKIKKSFTNIPEPPKWAVRPSRPENGLAAPF